MEERFDILGLGATTVDDLLYVPAYPPADSKVMIQRSERQCGGLTATALVAAARLGSQCVFAGALGDDEFSHFVLEAMRREGIDVTHVAPHPDAPPIHSIIIVDEGRQTRTLFYDVAGVVGALPDWPEEPVIQAARVLFVDHHGTDGMIRAARIARDNRIPVVADLERENVPRFDELISLVDHLILSRDFAVNLTGESDAALAAQQLWNSERQAVIITCGAEGCWCVTDAASNRAVHHPAFRVDVVDTTGCGDVFHGAYASTLARGLGIDERITIASAAAALKAMQRGGQAGIPTQAAVEEFLRSL
jgi:sugar/nucleoside kinase (ribokinase family)